MRTEAIAGERTARQLAVVRVRLEDLELRAAYPAPAAAAAPPRGTENHCTAIARRSLRPAYPTSAARQPACACQLLRHPGRVGGVLADAQQQVLAGAGGRETEVLLHHEVFRLRAQMPAAGGAP